MHKRLIFTIVLIGTAIVICLAHLIEPPLDGQCNGLGYLPSHSTTSVPAVKVVARPFFGQHQVFAVFMLPKDKCPPGQLVAIAVRGVGTYCEAAGSGGLVEHLEGINAAPGYYLMRSYIRTRKALWLSIKGLLGQLKKPDNWTLTYRD